jgi:hypothetical protein
LLRVGEGERSGQQEGWSRYEKVAVKDSKRNRSLLGQKSLHLQIELSFEFLIISGI